MLYSVPILQIHFIFIWITLYAHFPANNERHFPGPRPVSMCYVQKCYTEVSGRRARNDRPFTYYTQGWRKMLNSSGATSNFWLIPTPPPTSKNVHRILQLNIILTNEDNRILESINRTIELILYNSQSHKM